MFTLKDFFSKHGLPENFEPILNGESQNIKLPEFKGWYIGESYQTGNGKTYTTLTLGNWKTNEKFSFIEKPQDLTEDEAKTLSIQQQEHNARIEKELKEKEETCSVTSEESFDNLNEVKTTSPYLMKKKLEGNENIKIFKNSFGSICLAIPTKDIEGKIWGYQTIDENGGKSFQAWQRTEGVFFQFGTFQSEIIFICEGYATGESIYKATGKCVVVAFSISNLETIGKALRSALPDKMLVFCADNDQYGEKNYGLLGAKKAASKCQAQVIYPTFLDTQGEPTDFNDLLVLEGIDEVKRQIFANEFVAPHRVIATEHTGFHRIEYRKDKEVYIPDIDGLREYFERRNHYVVHEASEQLYLYTGKFYEPVGDKFVECFAERHFQPKPNNKTVREFYEKVFRTNVRKDGWFTGTIYKKINLQNGVLDVDTKELLPHSKDYGFKYILPYNYDPEAKAPRFMKMLNDVTKGDKDAQQLLLEFFGYALSNDECWAQKALILTGEGANGKSTVLDSLKLVLGENNCTAITMGQLQTESTRVLLEGKLANIAEETPNKKMFDSSIFKILVGGSDVQVRQLYKPAYIMRSRAKLIFACNELPDSSDVTHGFFRRLIIVPFNTVFSQENGNLDPFILDKIKPELSGILNMCLASYSEMRKRQSFIDVLAAKEALEEYARYNDPLREWIDDHITIFKHGNGADEKRVSIKKLYEDYSIYMENSGYRKPTRQSFGRALKMKIPDYYARLMITKDSTRKSDRELKALEYLSD